MIFHMEIPIATACSGLYPGACLLLGMIVIYSVHRYQICSLTVTIFHMFFSCGLSSFWLCDAAGCYGNNLLSFAERGETFHSGEQCQPCYSDA